MENFSVLFFFFFWHCLLPRHWCWLCWSCLLEVVELEQCGWAVQRSAAVLQFFLLSHGGAGAGAGAGGGSSKLNVKGNSTVGNFFIGR